MFFPGSTSQGKDDDAIQYEKTSDQPIVAITSDVPPAEPENIDPSESITKKENQSEGKTLLPFSHKFQNL